MSEVPPIGSSPPILAPSYRDRRTGLILFGILEILLGALCFLAAGFVALGQVMLARNTGQPTSMQMLIPGVLVYVGLAVALIWLGVGSIQCSRWARALLLIFAWVWLGTGILTVAMMAWIMPKILASAPAGGPALPSGTMTLIIVIQIVFMSVVMIVLPGVLVLFYRSRHVKDTCEARDPVRRWTDDRPLPVLGVVCLLWWGTLWMLGLPLVKLAMFPCFGILLTGLPGALVMIGMACAFFCIGWSWYRRKVAGWWALVAVMVIFSISNVLTFARVDMVEVYQKLGFPQAQIDLIRQQGWMNSRFMMWSCLIWVVPVLGYLLWVKRFFRRTS